MHALVRIIKNDDGDLQPSWKDWHLIDPGNPAGPATLCTGELFGAGESACVFEKKSAVRGGITCAVCMERLKAYKGIRL